MRTNEKASRPTSHKEWSYFNEGNAHMIFFNNHQEESNEFQDKVLISEKTNTGNYLAENVHVNEMFDRFYNENILRHPSFSKFITKQKQVDLEEGLNSVDFLKKMQEEADPKRREDRKKAWLGPESPFWLEKNLFYISPMMKKSLEETDSLIFFVEIKPKCCFNEIPSFEEINGYLQECEHSAGVDPQVFYDKLFKNCPPSERKFVYRKFVGGKHKIFSDFNTADFYSDRPFVRTKAIKALVKNNWGNYLKVLDKDMNIIAHEDILPFFRKWDDQITVKSISEIIARSVDYELIQQVARLQKMFQFYAEKLKTVQDKLEAEKKHLPENLIESSMKLLADVWKNGETVDLDKMLGEADENTKPFLMMTAFLISLTARDSSFLLRSAISRKSSDFSIIETWEEGKVTVKCDELKVKFHNAQPVGANEFYEHDKEATINFLGNLVDKKFNTGYQEQKKKTDTDEERHYYIKSRTNLIDVGLKPWNKLFEAVEKNYQVNKDFVNFFLHHKKDEFCKKQDE